MTHGIEALVGHFAQLLRDALLDHLEVFVPLLCGSFETGPLGALPLPNDGPKYTFRNPCRKEGLERLIGQFTSFFFNLTLVQTLQNTNF